MKSIYKATFPLIFCLLSLSAGAQADVGSMGFAYSFLIRDNAGVPLTSKPVTLRFTLLLGPAASIVNAPWVETQTITTDTFGFANVVIGMGTKAGGTAASFSGVDFSISSYWLLAEQYNNTTASYMPLEKKALQSVPYAKVAGTLISPFAPGTIVSFAGDTTQIPAGWMLCDGRELDNSNPAYLPLFQAIGYSWGTSDNLVKFNIPATNGMFLRGANNKTGKDPEANSRTPFKGGNVGDNVGSRQADAFQAHEHTAQTVIATIFPNGNFNMGATATTLLGNGGIFPAPQVVSDTKTPYGLVTASTETRPVNIYVNFIIKL
jgi:hypothetical protein